MCFECNVRAWVVRCAKALKYLAQIVVGAAIFGVLVRHAIVEFREIYTGDASNAISLAYTFKVLSYGLGISAGIEMAYMLFTEGPDEAVEPIILGLSAIMLYALAVFDLEKTNLVHFSILLISLGALIGWLFFVRERFVIKNR